MEKKLILADGFFRETVVLLPVSWFVCPDLWKGVCVCVCTASSWWKWQVTVISVRFFQFYSVTGTVKLRPAVFPSSLGTGAVMPACLSTWLLSLGAVPIPLICLLFSCERLCCNRRRRGRGGGIQPCFIDSVSRDSDDVLIWTRHKYIERGTGKRVLCSRFWLGLYSDDVIPSPLFYTAKTQRKKLFCCEETWLLHWLGHINAGKKTEQDTTHAHKATIEACWKEKSTNVLVKWSQFTLPPVNTRLMFTFIFAVHVTTICLHEEKLFIHWNIM